VLALDAYLRDVRPDFSKNPREGALFPTTYGRRISMTLLDQRRDDAALHARAGQDARGDDAHAPSRAVTA
jgi:site-specific recombinase XerD